MSVVDYSLYVPQGPSPSKAIRDFAEVQLHKLIASRTFDDRNQFLQQMTALNNQLLGIESTEERRRKQKIEIEASAQTVANDQLSSNSSLSHVPFSITSDMRVASTSSLDKLRLFRQNLVNGTSHLSPPSTVQSTQVASGPAHLPTVQPAAKLKPTSPTVVSAPVERLEPSSTITTRLVDQTTEIDDSRLHQRPGYNDHIAENVDFSAVAASQSENDVTSPPAYDAFQGADYDDKSSVSSTVRVQGAASQTDPPPVPAAPVQSSSTTISDSQIQCSSMVAKPTAPLAPALTQAQIDVQNIAIVSETNNQFARDELDSVSQLPTLSELDNSRVNNIVSAPKAALDVQAPVHTPSPSTAHTISHIEPGDELNLSGSWKQFPPQLSQRYQQVIVPDIHIHNYLSAPSATNYSTATAPKQVPQQEAPHVIVAPRGDAADSQPLDPPATIEDYLRPRRRIMLVDNKESMRESIDLSGLTLQRIRDITGKY